MDAQENQDMVEYGIQLIHLEILKVELDAAKLGKNVNPFVIVERKK